MARHRLPRRGERGFSLVELLVVIAVLGILAGVVVFAVRGTGDKGKLAAYETEARILSTAQELFCARHDRYATSIQELKDDGLLASDPGHSKMSSRPGACNGTGYLIEPCDGEGCVILPKGRWRKLADPLFGSTNPDNTFAVVLGDGRTVFHVPSGAPALQAQIFDPSAGVDGNGLWRPVPLPQGSHFFPSGVTLPGGDVLVRLNNWLTLTDSWYTLSYDPAAGIATFTRTADPLVISSHWPRPVVVLEDRGGLGRCGSFCGKALSVGGHFWRPPASGATPRYRVAEVYDPAARTWARTGDLQPAAAEPTSGQFVEPLLVALPDGRAMMLGDTAQVFEPASGSWRTVGTGFSGHFFHGRAEPAGGGSAAVLPDGRVLAVRNSGGALLFDPSTEAWTGVRACGCVLSGRGNAVPSGAGKVLVAARQAGSSGTDAPTAWLYDVAGDTWAQTDEYNHPRTNSVLVRLGDGRVMTMTGSSPTAEVYTPGPGG